MCQNDCFLNEVFFTLERYVIICKFFVLLFNAPKEHISTVLKNKNILEFTVYSGNINNITTAFRIQTVFYKNRVSLVNSNTSLKRLL